MNTFSEILSAGLHYFQLEIAIISHVVGDCYTIKEISSKQEAYPKGTQLPLGETYCKHVIKNQSVIYCDNIRSQSGSVLHPLYDIIQLSSYISAPLFDPQNNVWGTLNFSSFLPRGEYFSHSDITYIENLATQTEHLLFP